MSLKKLARNITMRTNAMPLFYHPSSILILDDDTVFLQASRNLHKNQYRYEEFVSDAELMEFISQYNFSMEKLYCDKLIDEDLPYTINYRSLYAYLCNKDRFMLPSVAIIDKNLENKSGIDVCKSMGHLGPVRVLLTGYADFREANAVHNKGELDLYFEKNIDEVEKLFLGELPKLSRKFFINKSSLYKGLTDIVSLSEDYYVLSNDFIIKNKIEEYYTIDTCGSLFGISSHGEIYWLIISNDERMQFYFDLAAGYGASAGILKELQEKKQIPFLMTDKTNEISPKDWGEILTPVKKHSSLYYSVFVGSEYLDWDSSKIVTFADSESNLR
jgi:hypothetical protein